jgi:hypothetical protein
MASFVPYKQMHQVLHYYWTLDVSSHKGKERERSSVTKNLKAPLSRDG